MKTPITQSRLWQSLQQDLGETSFYEQHGKSSYLAILKSTPVGNYLYLPYGPVYQSKAAFTKITEELSQLALKYKAFFIRIEPQDPNFPSYAPSNALKTTDLNPKETWLLDLKTDEAALRSKLPSRLLRYYRTAAGKGITIEKSHDPADLHYLTDLQNALARKKGINTFSEHYLKTELSQPFATLYLLKYQPNPDSPSQSSSPAPEVIATGLVFDDQTTRYNLQGAQSDLGRKLHATGILTIRLILDAFDKHLKTFDFWGIAPDGAPKTHPWAGFTAFKKSFGGYPVHYAGTYDLILSPTKYRLYQAFRSLNRHLRRL